MTTFQEFNGTDNAAVDTPAIKNMIAAIPGATPSVIEIVGKAAFNEVIYIEDRWIKFVGIGESEIRTETLNDSAFSAFFRFNTSLRTGIASTQSKGESLQLAILEKGTSRVTFPGGIPAAWASAQPGDWIQIAGGVDDRARNAGNSNDRSFGEPVKLESFDGNDVIFQGCLTGDIYPDTDGNVNFLWVERNKYCGVENITFRGAGHYIARFVDTQGFTIDNVTGHDCSLALPESSFDGVIRDCIVQTDTAFAKAGLRISYGCGNVLADNCQIRSNENAVDLAGGGVGTTGGGFSPHKDVLIHNCSVYDSQNANSTAPLRVHAAGNCTYRNCYVESNNSGSQGSAVVVEGINTTLEGCCINFWSETDEKQAVNFQANGRILNNVVNSGSTAIAVSGGEDRIDSMEIKGNDCTHQPKDGNIVTNSRGVSLGSTASLIYSHNVVVSDNILRGFDKGLYNAGDSTSSNRFANNVCMGCNDDTQDSNGSPGNSVVFQNTVTDQLKKKQ